jgi:hypothetical protein
MYVFHRDPIFFSRSGTDEFPFKVAAKYVFVRVLRDSRHLQANTVVHWTTWLGCTFGLGAISFIFAEAIPIFNYLNALTGSICFAPLAMILPGWLWLYDNGHYRTGSLKQQTIYWLHWGLILLGLFFLVGATYGVVLEINDAYRTGTIGIFYSSHLRDDIGTNSLP